MMHNTVWDWLVHGARTGWLPWIVGIVALIVLIAWIVRRSGNGRDK